MFNMQQQLRNQNAQIRNKYANIWKVCETDPDYKKYAKICTEYAKNIQNM